MSSAALVLVLCCFTYVCRAVPAVEPGDPRAAVFIEAFSRITGGSPGTSTTIDPLYISYFSGTFATLQYKNYNTTVTGLRCCVADDFILSTDGGVINFKLDCPRYTLYSSNEVQGYLMYKNMNGRGTLEIDYGRYVVRVYALLSSLRDPRGNAYYQIGPYSLGIDVIGPVNYNFKISPYYINQIQLEEINELANNNWDTVALFSREPVWYPIMDRLVASMNQCLRTTPVQY